MEEKKGTGREKQKNERNEILGAEEKDRVPPPGWRWRQLGVQQDGQMDCDETHE